MNRFCTVCGADFEAGFTDLEPWERKLFLAGSGCPDCEGVPDAPLTDDDLVYIGVQCLAGDGDPNDDRRILAALGEVSAPEPPPWRKPDPRVVKTCAGCGGRIVTDKGDVWPADEDTWSVSGSERPDEAPSEYVSDWSEIDGKDYCDRCHKVCTDCDDVLLDIDGLDYPQVFFAEDDHYGRDPRCEDCDSAYRYAQRWSSFTDAIDSVVWRHEDVDVAPGPKSKLSQGASAEDREAGWESAYRRWEQDARYSDEPGDEWVLDYLVENDGWDVIPNRGQGPKEL